MPHAAPPSDLVPCRPALGRRVSAAAARLTWTAHHGRLDPGWRRRLATIRRVSSLEPKAFDAWQQARIHDHVRWAVTAVPWFRERAPHARSLADLPVLGRRDVQRAAFRLRDPRLPAGHAREDASGGSTGEPVRVWHDGVYRRWVLATEVHVLEGWGLSPWCRMALVWGADRDLCDLGVRERLSIRLMGRRILNAFHMGEAEIERFASDMETFCPEYVQGYASALDGLATHLLRREMRLPASVRALRSSAEVLTAQARARIERAFGAPVRDFYGSRESASLAAECHAGRLHVLAHGRHLEIVDESGAPVPPETPGRVLVTDFTNRAFALIRYETGDVATWARRQSCTCGSPYPILGRVMGRVSDFLTASNGERIHGEWFTHLFYGFDGVQSFQVHQTDPGQVVLRTVGPAGADELADLLRRMRARLGEGVDVRWERVDSIPVGASGKRRFTLSDVDPWGPAP